MISRAASLSSCILEERTVAISLRESPVNFLAVFLISGTLIYKDIAVPVFAGPFLKNHIRFLARSRLLCLLSSLRNSDTFIVINAPFGTIISQV
jgi:hypothetical protein